MVVAAFLTLLPLPSVWAADWKPADRATLPATAEPALNYTVSWLGNTFAEPNNRSWAAGSRSGILPLSDAGQGHEASKNAARCRVYVGRERLLASVGRPPY
jgi:hypothetical protein